MTVLTNSSERTLIPVLNADEVRETARRAIEDGRRRMASIAAIPLADVTPANVLDAWDDAAIELEDAYGPISLLNSVHPDGNVRDTADTALIEEHVFMTDIFQNEALYERVAAVQPATSPQRQLQKDLLEAFEDSGVALPAEKRARFREISEKLAELAQEFAKNIRENRTRLTFAPEECDGLPMSYMERVPKDEQGNIVVGFDYPDYVPFMANAIHGEARKRYYIANLNRGTDRNVAIMDEIVRLRKETADLYGVPSFAHYVTKRRMVENPETVNRFLDEVKVVVTEAEQRDLEQLAALKGSKIERWDSSFYRERLREQRYAVDQEELRKYFPTAPTIRWMLGISERLYGVRFEETPVPTWHE